MLLFIFSILCYVEAKMPFVPPKASCLPVSPLVQIESQTGLEQPAGSGRADEAAQPGGQHHQLGPAPARRWRFWCCPHLTVSNVFSFGQEGVPYPSPPSNHPSGVAGQSLTQTHLPQRWPCFSSRDVSTRLVVGATGKNVSVPRPLQKKSFV